MAYSNLTNLMKLIEKLDIHPCLGLDCDGHCTKNCAAGGGHNINLVNFYKNKSIEIVWKHYYKTKLLYEDGINSAEERTDIGDLKREFDNAAKQLKNILELYQV